MYIDTLKINDFRNLINFELTACKHINIICGENGSGKTSILEAIYYLAHTKSFRIHLNTRITNYHATNFMVAAKLLDNKESSHLGVERTARGSHNIRYNSQNVSSIADITKMLPMKLLSNLSYTQFHTDSKFRRKLLNWGLFHVKPEFHQIWKEFENSLKQRNVALKQKLDKNEVDYWNVEIDRTSHMIHQLRQEYVDQIKPSIYEMFDWIFGSNHHITVKYYAGWDTNSKLIDLLEENYYRELSMGYTQFGAHRADFQLIQQGNQAHHHLSQGQQKLAAHVINLAQGKHLEKLTHKKTIYLIDDLSSELDSKMINKISKFINEMDAQVFITSIENQSKNIWVNKSIINTIEKGELMDI